MACEFVKTDLPEVVLIKPCVFKDDRGFFLETFHQNKYAGGGIKGNFVQDNHSHSKKNTIRGLHYQLLHPQGKLVYVVSGEIFDVAVDIRRGSPSFGKWTGVCLSSENKYQLYIPEGFAHGFRVLSETADVLYKCTELYYPDDDYGILWSDPLINIHWQVSAPILSKKDREYQTLNNIPESLLPIYRK
ncbi:MAG: dTDP-4-dehydrorhamnose 3,5-epimerase [Candidatus Kuenenia sp.]|nr:dTDP-4-dehydrorhamnose 3,5-epimerase [Candidatus Kuenenia hertensis]